MFSRETLVLDCHLRYQVYRGNIDRILTVSQTPRTTEIEKSFEDFFYCQGNTINYSTNLHPPNGHTDGNFSLCRSLYKTVYFNQTFHLSICSPTFGAKSLQFPN